jgi:erythromycin esterase
MNRIILVALFFIFHISCGFGQAGVQSPDFKSIACPINLDDIRKEAAGIPLDALKGKKIIGLGEATHGTGEFQMIKVEIIKSLVIREAYKVIGIEAGFEECAPVNAYICDGAGTSRAAVAGMRLWMWNTEEMVGLVDWLRRYNSDKPAAEQVRFYGFDMQFDELALKHINTGLIAFDSLYFDNHFGVFKNLRISHANLDKTRRNAVKAALDSAADYIEINQQVFLRSHTLYEIRALMQDVRVLQQCLQLDETANVSFLRGSRVNSLRDRFMAENVLWIKEKLGNGHPMVIWSHNVHVVNSTDKFEHMGALLKAALGDGYYAVGFAFNKGSFRAININTGRLEVFTVGESSANSLDWYLSQFALPAFFIDLGQIRQSDPNEVFFNKAVTQRNIGWGVYNHQENNSFVKQRPSKTFDGLVFVNETLPSIPAR